MDRPLVTLKPHIVEQITIRRRSADEIAQWQAERAAKEALRRATLPLCVCCDQPKEPRDLVKRPDGTPSETCFYCVNFRTGWRGRANSNTQLLRMKAINNRLMRETRYAG